MRERRKSRQALSQEAAEKAFGNGQGLGLTARSSRVTKPLSLAPQSWKKACSSAAAWEDQDSDSGAMRASWPSAGSRVCHRRLEPSFRPFRDTLCPLSMLLLSRDRGVMKRHWATEHSHSLLKTLPWLPIIPVNNLPWLMKACLIGPLLASLPSSRSPPSPPAIPLMALVLSVPSTENALPQAISDRCSKVFSGHYIEEPQCSICSIF